MMKNIGNTDKWIRIIVGALLMLYAAKSLMGWPQIIVLFIGMILIGTAILGGCYLYQLLGVNTRKGE